MRVLCVAAAELRFLESRVYGWSFRGEFSSLLLIFAEKLLQNKCVVMAGRYDPSLDTHTASKEDHARAGSWLGCGFVPQRLRTKECGLPEKNVMSNIEYFLYTRFKKDTGAR